MPPEYELVLARAWMDTLRLLGSVFTYISVSLLFILTGLAVNLAGVGVKRAREARAGRRREFDRRA